MPKMNIFIKLLTIVGTFKCISSCGNISVNTEKFPSNFQFGVATAAYQIEGGWNADGRGPSIWDTFTHDHPELIDGRANGDVADDSYNRFDQDLQALKELGVDFYRLSISWSRILPTGDISSLNSAGIKYYNNVIDKLVQNNMKPMVTMYHYDLPDELQKIGGLTNPLFVKYFAQYANVLYENFGNRVKTWITFNEPFDYCIPGYGNANYPPQIHAPGVADYLCIDHTIKAHALAYRLYRKKFYNAQKGKIGITLSSRFFFSKTNNTEVVYRGLQYVLGWLTHPIYSKAGGYPPIMVEEIASNSLKEGRAWSRLPAIEGEWKDIIRGAGDFLGLNYYTARYLEKAKEPMGSNPSWDRDAGLKVDIDPKWKRAKSSWLYCVPHGLENLLKYIRDEYDNVEVIITENGWSDDGQLNDPERIDYLKVHLQAVHNAIADGCNVTGYAVWSLIDNFEWLRGYTERFGLYAVNYNSTSKERTAKKSAQFYKTVIATRAIPDDY